MPQPQIHIVQSDRYQSHWSMGYINSGKCRNIGISILMFLLLALSFKVVYNYVMPNLVESARSDCPLSFCSASGTLVLTAIVYSATKCLTHPNTDW